METVVAPAEQLSLFNESVPTSQDPDFVVRRNTRARRLSITVHPSGRVEVLAPKRVSDRAVASFVRENAVWIHNTQRSFEKSFGPIDRTMPLRIDLPALGWSLAVRYAGGQATTVRCRQSASGLILSGKISDEALCRAALKRWLAATARENLGKQLAALSRDTGLVYKRLQVRGQKTCWGSHSSSGTISINYCLLFLDPSLVRYLLIHELSHSRHMNHSKRFWALVGKFEPDYKMLDRALGGAWTQMPGWLDIY